MGLPRPGRHAAAGPGAGLDRDARRPGGLLPAQAHQGDAIRSLCRNRRPGTASRHRPGVPRNGRLGAGAGEQLRRGNRTAGRQLPSPRARVGLRRGDGRQSRTEPQLRTPLAPRTARHGDRPCSPPGEPLCGPGADLGFGRRPAPRRDDGVVQKLSRSGGPQRRLPGLPHPAAISTLRATATSTVPAARPTGGGSSAWSKPRRGSRPPREAAVYPAARPAGLGAKA